MKKRVIWLVVSCLTVLSLLLAACAPAAVEKKPPAEVGPKAEVPKVGEVVQEKVAPVAETPKYGGVVILSLGVDVTQFDQTYKGVSWDLAQGIAYETLLVGDWARGAAGTGETDWSLSGWAPEGFFRFTGAIAESWEIPDNQTLIFKIRRGIYFHNKPPVNGREVDANDVAFSMNYMYHNPKIPNTYYVNTSPGGKKLLSATAPDKWTVVIKVEDNANVFIEEVGGRSVWIIPHESIEKYGNLLDWRNSLGTGPFMLTDYTPGSSLTYVKNPNYWMKDPVGAGKGNPLPYLDGVKVLIIPDKSTRLAAIRTGQIDVQANPGGATFIGEDIESLLKYNPEIKYKELPGANKTLTIRTTSEDPLAAPLMKPRVRYALQMAIDRESILKNFYQGKGSIWVVTFFPSSPYYIPLEKYPEHLRKLFTYNPTEAKKILAEEGYPNGFKTQLLLPPADVDLYAIVKDYWARNLNVDLEFDVREPTIYLSKWSSHNFPAMAAQNNLSSVALAEKWTMVGPGDPTKPPNVSNLAEFSHPKLDDFIRRGNAVYGDYAARAKVLQEAELFLIEQLWWLQLPAFNTYNVWQPWVKNYYGDGGVGYRHIGNYVTWAWLDQDLKKAGVRRR